MLFHPNVGKEFSIFSYQEMDEMPSHESRIALLRKEHFQNGLRKGLKIGELKTGRIIITDVLENRHKSQWMRMKDLLLEP